LSSSDQFRRPRFAASLIPDIKYRHSVHLALVDTIPLRGSAGRRPSRHAYRYFQPRT
jgi:hypothetical protein